MDIFTEKRKESFAFFSNTNDVRIAKVVRPHATKRRSKAEPFVLTDVDELGERIYHPLNVRHSSRQQYAGLEVRTLWEKCRHWKPIGQWLDERYGGVSRKRACMCLYWKFTEKTFELMQLPKELRDQIFDHLIGPVIWPRVKSEPISHRRPFTTPRFQGRQLNRQRTDQPRGLTGNGSSSSDLGTAETWKKADVSVDEDDLAEQDSPVARWIKTFGINNPAGPRASATIGPLSSLPGLTPEEEHCVRRLLSVSRAMCGMLEDAIARSPTAMFSSISGLADVICQPQAMPSQTLSLVSLRRVTLAMPIVSHFRLLGYGNTGRNGISGKRESKTKYLKCLANNPQLESLEFIFYVPGLRLPSGPELRLPSEDRYDTRFPGLTVEQRNRIGRTCQKILIDWFFTLLYVGILEIYGTPKKVPRVKFWGHVKNSTQGKWETMWEDLKYGEQHDFSGDLAGIRAVLDARLWVIRFPL